MAYKTPNKTCEYIRSLMSAESEPILCEIIADAESRKIPILLPESAAFTKQLVMLAKPENVLEIGTAIGYSGYIFLKNSNCKLTTVDKNAAFLVAARRYFEQAGFKNRYEIIEGNSDEIVPGLKNRFDFIFLDGPKTKYVKYLPYFRELLTKGGILLADNVLFNGMVAGETETADKKKSIVTNLELFLNELYKDKGFVTSVLNVGDGMSLSIKL